MERPRILVAVDAHKRTVTYAVFRGGELTKKRVRAPSTPATLSVLADECEGATVVFEACGVQEWMVDDLRARGVDARVVVPPKKDRKGPKSDTKDAERIGRLFLAGALSEVYVPPPESRRVRDVVRHHEYLTRKRTSFKNRLRHEMNRWNLDPSRTDATDDDGEDNAPGPYTRAARARVEGVLPMTADLYDLVWDLDKRLKRVRREMEAAGQLVPGYARARTIPGWGAKTALAFVIETGPVSRFQNARQLVSFFGLEPVHGQSGDSSWDEHRISKRGRSYVRGLLVEAAWTHVRVCPDSDASRWFRAATANGKSPKEAIVAVARRLVEAAFAMLRDDRDFKLNGAAPVVTCRSDAKA